MITTDHPIQKTNTRSSSEANGFLDDLLNKILTLIDKHQSYFLRTFKNTYHDAQAWDGRKFQITFIKQYLDHIIFLLKLDFHNELNIALYQLFQDHRLFDIVCNSIQNTEKKPSSYLNLSTLKVDLDKQIQDKSTQWTELTYHDWEESTAKNVRDLSLPLQDILDIDEEGESKEEDLLTSTNEPGESKEGHLLTSTNEPSESKVDDPLTVTNEPSESKENDPLTGTNEQREFKENDPLTGTNEQREFKEDDPLTVTNEQREFKENNPLTGTNEQREFKEDDPLTGTNEPGEYKEETPLTSRNEPGEFNEDDMNQASDHKPDKPWSKALLDRVSDKDPDNQSPMTPPQVDHDDQSTSTKNSPSSCLFKCMCMCFRQRIKTKPHDKGTSYTP